jgi:hypothetical protein
MDLRFATRTLLAACSFFLLASTVASFGADSAGKFEAQLIWGSNESKSPDPKHKPVEGALKKKLEDLPLKWKNYFEVNRKTVEVTSSSPKRVTMSDRCDIEIKLLGNDFVEVSLFGKGAPVLKRTQSLPKDETLVVAGNAPNSTAWLVVVKRTD